MKNAGLEETQAAIKISRRNISNLRYADNNTLMAESEEELKSLETKVKESESEFAQSCLTLCNPMDCAYQAPLSMGFSRQECWSGLPFPFPGDLLDPGIEPRSPALQADALPSEPPGKVKEESEKSSLNSTFQKTKIMASGPII